VTDGPPDAGESTPEAPPGPAPVASPLWPQQPFPQWPHGPQGPPWPPSPAWPWPPAWPPPGPGTWTGWPGTPAPPYPPYPPFPPPYGPYALPAPYRLVGPAPGLQYVGFWLRTLAALIDSLVVAALFVGIGVIAAAIPSGGAGAAIGAAILIVVGLGGWLALQIVVPGRSGGTLGMRALGIWIVREQDGSQIGYALAAGRLGVYLALGWLTLGIGTIVDVAFVAFDARKQSVHDKACSTLVIKRV
jgi:uncharacterized RDD family membrane protein YckC